MSFFDRLFKNEPSSKPHSTEEKKEPTGREVADNPILFADWVNEYIVLGQSFESDYELAPDEEQCKRLSINNDERISCANEFVLLRALGACLFVRHNRDEKYYLAFRSQLLPLVVERMNRCAPHNHSDNPAEALEQYLEDLKSESHVAFSMTYISRVYPQTPSSQGIFLSGIPIHLGYKYAMEAFKSVRDGFCLLLTGFHYDALEKLNAVIEKTDIDKTKGT